jgi:hypothetical protein
MFFYGQGLWGWKHSLYNLLLWAVISQKTGSTLLLKCHQNLNSSHKIWDLLRTNGVSIRSVITFHWKILSFLCYDTLHYLKTYHTHKHCTIHCNVHHVWMYWHHSGAACTQKRSAHSETNTFHFMECFKERHLSRIYLVMYCMYLLYFLEDKTVLISLENTKIYLPYKFPLKYECLKVHKLWYMYFVSAG